MNPPGSEPLPEAQPRPLVEAIRQTIRRLHYSSRTEEAYIHWTRAFIASHGGRHPRTLGAPDATASLNHLAVDRRVSSSTQNQALCALLFLYRRVLDLDLPQLVDLERARRLPLLRIGDRLCRRSRPRGAEQLTYYS